MRVQWHACGSQRTPLGVGTFLPLSFRDPAMFLPAEPSYWPPHSLFKNILLKLFQRIFLGYPHGVIEFDLIFIYLFIFYSVRVCAHVLVCVWCALCTCGSYFSLPCGWVLGIDQVGSAFAFTSYTTLLAYLPTLPSLHESGFHLVDLAGFLHIFFLSQLPG